LTGKEGMGFGDFKLLAALGAWFGVAALLPIILLSSICGAVIGIALQLLKLTERGRPIPFGPFLAAAGILLLLIGPNTLVALLLPASGA
jgi:type 4 prepilin peptidase 1 (EC:3.4.23.43). Aspartic peptidase. MEROPS family A24A